jgi:hypothetical protein
VDILYVISITYESRSVPGTIVECDVMNINNVDEKDLPHHLISDGCEEVTSKTYPNTPFS